MCGIFGFLSRPDGSYDGHDFAKLTTEIITKVSKRGDSCFGVVKGPELTVVKGLGPWNHPARVGDIWSTRDKGGMYLLGHSRAPTDGEPVTLDRCHPFIKGDLLLAHNGILEYPDHSRHISDSEYLLYIIFNSYRVGEPELTTIPDSISMACEGLKGQFACWLWHNKEERLYLFRNFAPIYLIQCQDFVAFSSCPIPDVGGDRAISLRPGVVYSVALSNLNLVQEAEFKYTTPYDEEVSE